MSGFRIKEDRMIPCGSTNGAVHRRLLARSLALLSTLALGLIVGCGKSDEVVVDVQPATQPTATQPTTGPASTQPVVLIAAKPADVFVTMDDRLVKFPPAKLLVREDENGMIAQLTTMDQPDEDPDTANSLFISMRLSESELANISKANWHYRAADELQQEPARGFFLAGGRRILQPYDVEMVFDKKDDGLHIKLAGKFLSFDNSPSAPEDQPPKVVPIAAQTTVQVEALQ